MNYRLLTLLLTAVYILSHICTRVHSQECTTEGDIRLVNGRNKFEGRVEYCNDRQWKSVCNNGFFQEDVMVACRQLRFSGNLNPVHEPDPDVFGRGTNGLIRRAWSCTGTEDRLMECTSFEAPFCGINANDDREVAGLYCFGNITDGCIENEIRLVNDSNQRSGRVEVCLDGRWGTVCDDGWDVNDTTTVCRQLGYNEAGIPTRDAYFGEGNGPIHLSRAQCTTNDIRLTDCNIDRTAMNGCAHKEDAGVICQGPTNCTDGDIQLVGGENEREGRVEICYNGVWGTVCDYGWDQVDASVVCTELGWTNLTAVLLRNLGAGDGPVLLSNVSCNQSHTRLSQCVHTEEIGLHSCESGRIAGVACRTDAPTTTSSTTTSSEVPTSSTTTSTVSPTNPIPPVPSANTMPQLGAIIGAVAGVLAVGIIATILVVVVIVLVAKRRSKGERVTTKGPGPSVNNPISEENVIYKTATLKELKNPIYSGPDSQTPPTIYDGVYSEAGTEIVRKPHYQNIDGSPQGGVRNGGSQNNPVGGNFYSKLDRTTAEDQRNARNQQPLPPTGIYSEADDFYSKLDRTTAEAPSNIHSQQPPSGIYSEADDSKAGNFYSKLDRTTAEALSNIHSQQPPSGIYSEADDSKAGNFYSKLDRTTAEAPSNQQQVPPPVYDGIYSEADNSNAEGYSKLNRTTTKDQHNVRSQQQVPPPVYAGIYSEADGNSAEGYSKLDRTTAKGQHNVRSQQQVPPPVYDGIYSEADSIDTKRQNGTHSTVPAPSNGTKIGDDFYSIPEEGGTAVQPHPHPGLPPNVYDGIYSEADAPVVGDASKSQNTESTVPGGGISTDDNFYSTLEERGAEVQPHIYDQQLLPESKNGYSCLQHK